MNEFTSFNHKKADSKLKKWRTKVKDKAEAPGDEEADEEGRRERGGVLVVVAYAPGFHLGRVEAEHPLRNIACSRGAT